MFYVVSIQTVGDSHPCSIFAFSTKEEAMSRYHSTLASNYIATNLDSFSTVVLNEHGGTEAREYWEKPINSEKETSEESEESEETEETEETE